MDEQIAQEVLRKLERIETTQEFIKETQTEIKKQFTSLPCEKHQEKINDLRIEIPNIKLWVIVSGCSAVMGILAMASSLVAIAKAFK